MAKYLDYHGLETLKTDLEAIYVKKSQKGEALGVASLDANGKVPTAQLPAIESLPSGGTAGQVLTKASGTDYDVEWANTDGVTDVQVNGASVVTSGVASISIASPTSIIDDSAGIGDITKVWSANKVRSEIYGLSGLPSGGTVGQVLGKASGTDYDVEWMDQTGGDPTTLIDDTTNISSNKVWSVTKVRNYIHPRLVYKFLAQLSANNHDHNMMGTATISWSSTPPAGGYIGVLSLSDNARVVGYSFEHPEYLKNFRYTINANSINLNFESLPWTQSQKLELYVEDMPASTAW